MKVVYLIFTILSILLVPVSVLSMINELSLESIGLFFIASTGVFLGYVALKEKPLKERVKDRIDQHQNNK